MLSPLILYPSLLLFTAGSDQPALEQEVQEAIQAAARQTFHGRMQFRQEALFPPSPELADEAAAFQRLPAPSTTPGCVRPTARFTRACWNAPVTPM